jgi:hypothetical protein
MSESKVDFHELQGLINQVRRAQSSLDAGVQGFSGAPAPTPTPTTISLGRTGGLPTGQVSLSPTTTFGNTDAGATCLNAHSQARSTMDGTLKAFARTVDSDAERLEASMAAYKKMDAESADNLLATNRNQLDILTAHLANGGETANLQAAEIAKLRGLTGDPTNGNMVVSGDFNAASEGNSPSAQQIQQFGKHGFDVDAGDIHDGPGGSLRGTSLTHKPIDQLMPRGLGASEAQRWARAQSDHDGQEVDLTLPNW